MTGSLTLPRYLAYWLVGLAATALVLFLCAHVGSDGHPAISLPEKPSIAALRWNRVFTAALVGAALSASGVLLQALLKNPLADPYVLGISSGSSLSVFLWMIAAAAIWTAIDHGSLPAWLGTLMNYGEVLPALVGALLTCALVFLLARASSRGALEPLTLLLVGVVVSAFCGGLILLLNAWRPNHADIWNILVGFISDGISPAILWIAAAVFALGWLAGILAAGQMNIASLSDAEAATLGVRLARLRTLSFIAASVMTAAAIALARAIGFVGLICPHICRQLFGPDHRQLIVTAPFCGAIFLMLADTLALLLRPHLNATLPVGVVTALAGGPFFLILLRRTRGSM